MKWFKQDSMALYDPKLRNLINDLGVEGTGTYWSILTYVSAHGVEFQVRILGVGENSRKVSGKFKSSCDEVREGFGTNPKEINSIPPIALSEFAKLIGTKPKKLLKAIDACVALGLIDAPKWNQFAVIYTPLLALSQDEYTKKVARNRDRDRSVSGHTPENVSLEQEQETEQEEEKQKEKKMENNNEKDLKDLLKSALNVEKLSTPDSQEALVPPVTDEDIKQFRHLVWEDIQAWNHEQHANFHWLPTEAEIGQLLRGGTDEHKLRLCYQAMNLLGGDATYPHVVRRAVRMMLEASNQTRINKPYGWLWTCLHGNAGGTPPWVQLATRREES